MLTTITIFIIALHMSVTFPAGLTTETKLWSLGGFAFLALVSLLSCRSSAGSYKSELSHSFFKTLTQVLTQNSNT